MGFGPHSWELMRKLGAKRWLAPSFPVEYWRSWAIPYLSLYCAKGIGLSEPDPNYDASGINLQAVQQGNDFLIHGTKVST